MHENRLRNLTYKRDGITTWVRIGADGRPIFTKTKHILSCSSTESDESSEYAEEDQEEKIFEENEEKSQNQKLDSE